MTFREGSEWFLDHLKSDKGSSAHTVEAYGRDLALAGMLLEAVCKDDVESLDRSVLIRLESVLATKASVATAKRRWSALRSMLKFLARNGVSLAADLPDAPAGRRQSLLPKAIDREKIDALMDSASLDDARTVRTRALFELLFGGGLRISEALSIGVQDLDLTSKCVRVIGKRSKVRVVPLPSRTCDWLQKYLLESRPKLAKRAVSNFFLSDRGLALCRQTAYKLLRKGEDLAGLSEKFGPHALRHSYAVQMIKGGANLREVQELLGHASISSTQVYTHLDLEEVRKRYESAHPRASVKDAQPH